MIKGYCYAVQLHFDEHSERIISNLIDILRKQGLTNPKYLTDNYQPHISLAVFKEMDEHFADYTIKSLSEKATPFTLHFSHLIMFNADVSALCLGPTVTSELNQIHQQVHSSFSERPEKCWKYYEPSNWVPHCALLIDDIQSPIIEGARVLFNQKLQNVIVETICMTGFKRPYKYRL